MNKKLRTFVYPVCAFIVLLLLWQVCVMLSTSEIAFPTPVAVFKEFFYILIPQGRQLLHRRRPRPVEPEPRSGRLLHCRRARHHLGLTMAGSTMCVPS